MSQLSPESRSPMYVHSVTDDAGLSLRAFRVLGHLCRRAGADGRAFPAVSSMAIVTGLDERTVRRALSELISAGFVIPEIRPGFTTNYRLAAMAPAEGEDALAAAPNPPAPANPSHQMPPPILCLPSKIDPSHGMSPPPSHFMPPPPSHKMSPEGIHLRDKEKGGQNSQSSNSAKKPSGPKTPAEPAEDTSAANSVTLGTPVPLEIQELWDEWRSYRTGRATTGPKSDHIPWTGQAARMSAKQIENALAIHPVRIVADRIRSAIAGNWRGLNLDKIAAGPSGWGSRSGNHSSQRSGITTRRGAAL